MPTPSADIVFQPASSMALDPTGREGFNPRNAWFLAHLSRVAYLDEEDARERCQKLGFIPSTFQWFAKREDAKSGLNHDTQSFIAAHEDYTVVAFRGTTNGSDWATNVNMFEHKTPHGGVHRGFSEAVDTVWGRMLPAIKQLREQSPKKPIFVCGHSLGAALASVATARLVLDEGIPVASLYTIGSPRVFMEDFVPSFDEAMKEKCFRAVNNNDIVTRVPFDGYVLNISGFNFAHVAAEVYINRSGNVGSRNLWDSFAGRFQALFGGTITDGVEDHGAVHYEEAFRKEALKASKDPLSRAAEKLMGAVMEIVPSPLDVAKDRNVPDLAKELPKKMAELGVSTTSEQKTLIKGK
ncbi:unnamed protein product [Discosporangium mesarthrocarpum]